MSDLLFFGRLTDKMLPEETYHSWAYVGCYFRLNEKVVADGSVFQIPITAEGGEVGGFFNTTFESTSKILYERRIQILRTLGDKTGGYFI